MTLQLLWDRGPQIAALVASKLEYSGFGPCYAVGFVDIEKRHCCGGIVLSPRGGGFDGEISIYLEPGYSFNKRILRELFDFPFNYLQFVRLTSFVARPDRRTRRIAERLGFRYEGCMKLGYDGKQNACIYGMLKSECKWLPKQRLEQDGLQTSAAA